MSFTSFNEGTRWSDVHAAAMCAFLAGTAMFTADFALAIHLQSTGHGGAAVAALIICATLPLVVLAPVTGRMADRFDSRALMAFSGVLQAAAIVAMTRTDELYLLLGLVVLNACGTALLQPTVSALVPAITAEEDLPRAIALVQTGTLLGLSAGPAAAGFVIAAHSVDAALIAAACCALLRSVLSCDIRTRRGGIRRDLTERRESGRLTWNLRGDRLLLTMVVGLSAVIGALCAVNVLSVFLVREVYGASESTYGLVRASWTIGMVAGAWIAAALIRRMRRDSSLAWLQMACLAGIGLVSLVQGVPLFTVLLLVPINLIGGVFNAGENSALGIAVARRVPERFRGRANASIGAKVNGATLSGYFLGGVLSTFLEVRTSFLIVGLVSVAIVALCVPGIRRATRAEADEDATPESERVMAAA
ncbi:MFS transporter [Glycomyces tarimensis]